MNQKENLKQFEQFPIIRNQFDYVEFGLIKKSNIYTVVYTFVKANHETKSIQASCMIETAIQAFTYIECAKKIHDLIQTAVFVYPVMATGSVYDEKFESIEDINWNLIQKECAEFVEDIKPETIH